MWCTLIDGSSEKNIGRGSSEAAFIMHASNYARADWSEGNRRGREKKIERERETKGTSFDFGCTGSSSFRLRAALMTRFSCSSFH